MNVIFPLFQPKNTPFPMNTQMQWKLNIAPCKKEDNWRKWILLKTDNLVKVVRAKLTGPWEGAGVGGKKPLNILFCLSKYLHPSSSAEDLPMFVVFALFETLWHLHKQGIKLLPCDSTPCYLCQFFIDLHWGRMCGQLLN